MNWLQLIERRHSVRKYELGVDVASVARIKEFCQNTPPLELRMLPGSEVHGFTRGVFGLGRVLAPWYIVAITAGDKDSLLNLGYVTQRIILEMTALGFGTCWLGSFNREQLNIAMGLEGGLGARILVAWGRPKDENASSQRQGKRISPSRISAFEPGTSLNTSPWRVILEAVRWAPSAINRQPWRLWFTPSAIHLYSVSGVGKAYTPIEMGIALCHLELACKHLAISGRIAETEHPGRRGWEYWASFVRD